MKNFQSVLHVDSDLSALRSVESYLTKQGYQVESLEEAERALDVLLEKDIRVVILDLQLPGMSGLDLLSQIKEENAGIQVIALTSPVSLSSVLESMRGGAEACFFKPLVDFAPLEAALEASFQKNRRWWTTLLKWRENSKIQATGGIR